MDDTQRHGGKRTHVCPGALLRFYGEIKPHIERQEARMRQPIGVQARVALTLWRLATSIEY